MIRQSSRAPPGRLDRLAVVDDAALDVGGRALVLLHERAGQDDVGVARRLGEEEVDDGEELELLQRLARRTRWSGSETSGLKQIEQQALDLGRRGSPRPVGTADEPLVRDATPRGRPRRSAMCCRCSGFSMSRAPGSWSHFCPCSRPPWPLPWPVIIAYPQPSLPDPAGGEDQVDARPGSSRRPCVWCSMPRAWSRKLVRRRAPHLGRAHDHRARARRRSCAAHSGVYRAPSPRPPPSPWCAAAMKRAVDPAALDHDVQHGVEDADVAAGAHRDEEVGGARDRRHARVEDDDLGAVLARPPEVVGGDRARTRRRSRRRRG